MTKEYLGVVLIAGLGLVLVSIAQVSAQQPLTKETLGGNVTDFGLTIEMKKYRS